jgi:tol-pal system protein YbgF
MMHQFDAAEGRSRRARWALLLALMVGAWPLSCVTSGEGDQIKADLAALKKDLEAERSNNALDKQRLEAESAMRAQGLKDALDQLNRASRKSGADLAVDLEKAQLEIAQLKGAQEVAQHRLDALETGNVDRDKKLDAAWALVEKSARKADAAEHPTDKAAVYALGLKKLEAGDPARARELFSDFLAKFKGDELADNAQYWLGETWYAEKRYNDAIVEFQKVLKDYKASDKASDALLKIGLSFQSQGDCPKALLFYDEVTANHRATASAKLAREKSAECKKKR